MLENLQNKLAKIILKYRQGHLDEAISDLRLLSVAHRDSIQILQAISALLIEKRRYEEAIGYLNQAMKLPEKSAHLYNLRSIAAKETGSIVQARNDILSAIEIDSKNSEFYFTLAAIERQEGTFEGAIQSLRKSITLNTNFAEAYVTLGHCFCKIGLMEVGQKIIRLTAGLIKISPNGDLVIIKGNLNEAFKYCF